MFIANPYPTRTRGIIVNCYIPRLSLSHWLILGHVALTKIKCIPIVIHLSNVPHSGYITARDRNMMESGVTEGEKKTASFLFHFKLIYCFCWGSILSLYRLYEIYFPLF